MRSAALYVVGFALITAGMVMVTIGSTGSQNTSTGVVVFVGPIPIVLESGTNGSILVLIALVIAVGMILLFYLPFVTRRRTRE